MILAWIKRIFGLHTYPTIKHNEFDFVAIDFETANSKKSSICSCGIVAVKNKKIVEEKSWLIKPKDFYFHERNVEIHGIKKEDVENEAEFDVIWPEIKKYIDDGLVIAHNTSFDIFALKGVLKLYNLPLPKSDYLCTVRMSKKASLGTKNNKLNTVAEHFQIKLDHHEALSDARACANIAIKICDTHKSKTIDELAYKLKLKVKSIS